MWNEYQQTHQPPGGPCVACPIGERVPQLHPLSELAVDLYGLLNGGPAMQEVYKLKEYQIEEDTFALVVAPLMGVWGATVAEIDREKAEKAAKEKGS